MIIKRDLIKILALAILIIACVITGTGFSEQVEQKTDESEVLLGITPFPKGSLSEWTDDAFTQVFQKAREGGMGVAVWRCQWGEIEQSLGKYDWAKDLDYQAHKTKQHGLKYSLVIEIIHTNMLGKYPRGIKFKKFNHPAFVKHFKNFIRELLKRYNGRIDYLWIGNEVDMYLHNNPRQIAPFLNFYQEIEDEIKSIDSSIVVGIVGAYHLARNNNRIKLLQDCAKKGDAIGLTVYMEEDNANPNVLETKSYFDELMSLFPKKKVAVIETAWSSRGAKGSEERQSEYVKEISRLVDNYKDRLLFFSWLLLYDLPNELNRQVVGSFGIDVERPEAQQFLKWHGSLGLLNNDGSEKPAWQAWKKHMIKPECAE